MAKDFVDLDKIKNLKINLVYNLGFLLPVVMVVNAIINGIIAYILFIAKGGYAKQIQLVKEYGFFGGYEEKFTTGTTEMILTGVAGKILLSLVILDFIVLLIQYFRYTGKVKKVLIILDSAVISIAFTFFVEPIREYINYYLLRSIDNTDMEIDEFASAILLGAIILFIILMVITEECKSMLGYTAWALLISLIAMPLLILFLENVIVIVTGIIAIAIIVIVGIIGIAIFFMSSDEGNLEESANASVESTYSQKTHDKVKEDDMFTSKNKEKKDTNTNHHYIASYDELVGSKLYKVKSSLGDYIMLENPVTTRKVCTLKEAESGKHKFYREGNGKEIKVSEIPWK